MKCLLKFLIFTLLVAACNISPKFKKGLDDASDRSAIDEDAVLEDKAAEVLIDTGRAIKVSILAFQDYIQSVTIPDSYRFGGFKISFYPASFGENVEVLFAEGRAVANHTNLSVLGIPSGVKILAASTPILMTWSREENAENAVMMTLNLPPAASLLMEGEETESASDMTVGIIYQTRIPGSDETNIGFIDAGDITSSSAGVTFGTIASGIFQVVKFDSDVIGTKKVDSKEGLRTSLSGGNQAPEEFSLTSPVQDLAKTPYLPASALVSWDPSSFANFYNLNFSESVKCSSPVKSYKKLTSLSQSVSGLESGTHYFCVTAINDNGGQVATNNGELKIVIDAEIPAAPAQLNSEVSTNSIVYSWPEPSDLGPSGIGFYEAQIGTTSGGSDLFDGTVTELEKEVSASSGVTYYARMRVVDGAGNISEWSKTTGGESP